MQASNSRIQTYKACRRLYELKYIYNLIPAQNPEALETGLNYHQKIERLLKDNEMVMDEDVKTNAMITAFRKYIFPNLNIAKVEDVFEYKISDKNMLIGRIDGLDAQGKIIEHKSTSSDIDEVYWAGLDNNEQILTYMLAYHTNSIIYTACKKPTIRQKQNETIEEFEARCIAWYDDETDKKIGVRELFRTDEELAEFKAMQDATISEMENATLFYRNENNCMRWGRMCEFAPICKHYDPNQNYIEFIKKE